MDALLAHFSPLHLALATGVMLFANFAKGVVGFGMPMIVVAGMGSFLPAEAAIAAIVLPGLITNTWQSLRDGMGAALTSLREHWRLFALFVPMVWLSAQLVLRLPASVLFAVLGLGVTGFCALQLAGWRPVVAPHRRAASEIVVALVAGFFGGLAGVWGPPIVLLLLALGAGRAQMVRVQGLAFLIGSGVLMGAHLHTGLLAGPLLAFSAVMVLPAVAGMAIGLRLQDRLDPATFRRATLVVLLLAGLNLLRRAFLV